ncbi:50S ribosomal protein L25/general stress protein Ctc [Benzoatithermus flavus]|uniref:Large ribosomal subunit protein bL25 n=1 Tax=Benzoatithermus flavus TaxID=3108223 RepID=A0ABU8XRP9_9PROT
MATVFSAERREKSGKGPARALRREGKIPAIVYGGRSEPVPLAVPFKDIKRELGTNPRFFSTVFELDFGGERLKVLPREVQLHPVSDDPLHVDFLRAETGATITVEVPVRFVHEDQSPGMKRGGVLNIVRRTLELVCPADGIPGEIVIDLAGREIGDSVHISQVTLPAGVRPTITDRDFTICSIVPPTVATETKAATGEAGPAS